MRKHAYLQVFLLIDRKTGWWCLPRGGGEGEGEAEARSLQIPAQESTGNVWHVEFLIFDWKSTCKMAIDFGGSM
jgi:hypothetical protein